MQPVTLQGEQVLVVEDEPLIALNMRATLEREGASVIVAHTMPEALRYAEHPALSAGVLDFRVGAENAEPICEALNRRAVPFIFFTGLAGRLSSRWATTPVVSKPAAPEQILGALRFVLSPETPEIIVSSQRNDHRDKLARIDQIISESEERLLRMRRCITQLANSGADTSAAQAVLATTTDLVEELRAHKGMSARFSWKLVAERRSHSRSPKPAGSRPAVCATRITAEGTPNPVAMAMSSSARACSPLCD
jgi:response regulator RpfG family c-di-GMP phosphodiesterase